MSDLTLERLKELLHYDPQTGVFTWLVSNHMKAGDRAGCMQPPAGRGQACRRIRLDGKAYLESRLAWLYMTGRWPPTQVDHRNRNPLDNCWSNLRVATCSQNCANRGRRSDNKTGFKGVTVRNGRYSARVVVGGKKRHLGVFDTPDAAFEAYKEAAAISYGEFMHHD